MSKQMGHVVLRAVAEQYRTHPGSWDRGAGTLAERALWDFEEEIRPGETGCMDTMIRFIGKRYGSQAAAQATQVLCLHHGLAPHPHSIWSHNDHCCNSARDAIAFLEAPLQTPDAPKLADIDSLMPEPGAIGKRVAAMAMVALCMGAIGFAFHLPLI
jgi:hypothetical protein